MVAAGRTVYSVFNREVIASYALLASLIALERLTTLRALQIPGDLLMVGYGVVETVIPALAGASRTAYTFYALFAAYLYVLAIGVAWLVRRTGKT
ncbi:hypothetical protein [Haloarchaeobius sp. HRN-SO-5]|uniref:hypothetical protein n=1 Tax=Haloarchaeobius sp. HRN-SO-5 TaxID=3446118 RepID=UPI003EB8FDE7